MAIQFYRDDHYTRKDRLLLTVTPPPNWRMYFIQGLTTGQFTQILEREVDREIQSPIVFEYDSSRSKKCQSQSSETLSSHFNYIPVHTTK